MAKGGFVDIATREAQATEIRRAKKAAASAGAGKNKAQKELKFSLAKEDRYIRPVASLETVSEMFPTLSSAKENEPLFVFFAAKPEQVSFNKIEEYLDRVPLVLHERVNLEWIKNTWPSLLNIVSQMKQGDIQQWKREIQNTERIWKTTLFVKRIH